MPAKTRPNIITGMIFTDWLVLGEPFHTKVNDIPGWWVVCQCTCGYIAAVNVQNLKNKLTKRCGRNHKPKLNFIDLTGEKFGHWLVLNFSHFVNDIGETQGAHWLCKCVCGKEKIIASGHLKNKGSCPHCGCLGQVIKHGYAREKKSKEYTAYHGAKDRCTNPKSKKWNNYGGRGIQFLFKNFAEFIKDIGDAPSPNHSINRINNDGHYEIGNIEWATYKQQARNRRARKL